MKRLLCILSNMNAGGAETYLMKLHRNLDSNKYQMDYCVNVFNENFYEKEIKSLGGKIYKIPSRSANYNGHKEELKKIIVENNYKYVLAVTSNAFAYFDLRLAKKNGVQVCVIRSSNSNLNDSVRTKIIKKAICILFSHYADIWFAPSDLAAVNLFGKKYKNNKKFYFLPNALDLSQYKYNLEYRSAIRKELGVGNDQFVVGHVGRFFKQKNHEFLIDIFNEIYKKNKDSVLVLVGSGDLESRIAEKVHNMNLDKNVIFAGTRSDICCVLSAFDIFIFPSFYEGMPNTVLEAEANGLPCLISSTITRDASLLENVQYLSLSESPNKWANEAFSLKREADSTEILRKKGYDINQCVDYFERVVFEQDGTKRF